MQEAKLIDLVRYRFGGNLPELMTVKWKTMVATALARVSREALRAEHRPLLEVVNALTLSARDAFNVQSVALPGTILAGSVMLIDDVQHTDLTLPLVQVPSYADLMTLLSTSVLGYYTVADNKIYAARPGGTPLATTASALKVRGITLLTDITTLPPELDDRVVDAMIELTKEGAGADNVESVTSGVAPLGGGQ